MMTRIEAALHEADAARADLMSFVGALPSARLSVAVHDDSWSPLEVLEHLRLVEESTVKLLDRRLQRAREAGLGSSVPEATAHGDVVPLPDVRVRAPDFVRPGQGLSPAEVLGGLENSRAALHRLVAIAREFDVSTVMAEHPVLGELNLYQWIHFLGAHERRHLAQIARSVATISQRV
ncbi:MAG: hypothetical protein MNPFHGCM_00344 [Gemmatimonadaceae bacterium]|nr:hypothetical protein [Gemmatimonadaceae bacterium]